MIEKISFKAYKSYKDLQELEFKPITILFGKNSSGKSSVAKLPTMIEEALKGTSPEPIKLNTNEVELGTEFKDLLYGRIANNVLEFKLISSCDKDKKQETLEIKIASGIGSNNSAKIIYWKLNNREFKYNHYGNTYFDTISNKEYTCEFNGFCLDKIHGTSEIISRPEMEILTSYIGPFREIPKSTYTENKFDKTEFFGIKGENAYYYLIKDYQTPEKELINKVSHWFKQSFDGWGINVIKEINRAVYSIELLKENTNLNIDITNVGQGMSQVLPLVVRAYYPAKKPTTIIFEQPELHLHSSAHGNLAELFINSLDDKNKRYLIETHSQNFILRVRRLIAEGKFNKDDLALYFVDFDEENNKSKLVKIVVDKLGRVDNWPEHIFRDSYDEASALRTAQIERTNAD
jgi:predicted ATPase